MWNLFEVRRLPDFHVLRPGDEPGGKYAGHVIRGRDAREGEEGGGDTKLLDSIPARLDASGLERLAVVIDADYEKNGKGVQSRWDSIRGQLAAEGYESLPKSPNTNGTVCNLPAVHGRKPICFGVWIMPNNRSEGMLEDFVAGLIHEDDDMLPIVDNFLGSISDEKRRFKEIHRAKARVHTWLAVSEKPGRPMGQAIKADRQLDANHPAVQPFLDWVQQALIE
jgi:hypothetical protein